MRQFFILLMAGLFAATVQAAEVYKWVDKDGNVHYGDKPKREDAEQVAPRPGTGTGEPEDPDAAQAAATRAAECERKKQQLATYRKAATIKETDNLGRVREYTEAERQQLITLTEQQVTAACSPPAEAAAAE